MKRVLLASVRMALVTIVVTGVLYPLAVWAIGTLVFHDQASGSLLVLGDEAVGSRLIGQQFTSAEYFHSRPSAADYDAMRSSPSNLGPTSKQLISDVAARVAEVRTADDVSAATVPVDLVTASASGLDPHISPDSAYLQVARVARQRGLSEGRVRALVDEHVEPRQWGFLGEPRVNVLELNVALDGEG